MLNNVSNRDIILLYAYDLAKQEVDVEPWNLRKLPVTAYIRQVEAREILKKYGRSANPGSVHKILQSDYFRRLGENIRSPYIPSAKGWEIVKEYMEMVINGKEIMNIWRENNIVDGKLKPYNERKLLLDIVMGIHNESLEENEKLEDDKALDVNEQSNIYEEDKEVIDFVEYMALGTKYKSLGMNAKAYEYFEKALEVNELLIQIPYNMSLILGEEGYYKKALELRNEYWKRYENYLMRDKRNLGIHLEGEGKITAEKLRYYIMEGDISSAVKYFYKLAEEIDKEGFANSNRIAQLARKYAKELSVLL